MAGRAIAAGRAPQDTSRATRSDGRSRQSRYCMWPCRRTAALRISASLSRISCVRRAHSARPRSRASSADVWDTRIQLPRALSEAR
ncbi:hypothetical protein MBT84_36180 [Streptomyces sp. MBT84]|nr:hypothetical protein [Streptomyces sp. MBT84]